jgi:hypothetical protein
MTTPDEVGISPHAAILLKHLDQWANHARGCTVDGECPTCVACFNLVVKAHTIWHNRQPGGLREAVAELRAETTPVIAARVDAFLAQQTAENRSSAPNNDIAKLVSEAVARATKSSDGLKVPRIDHGDDDVVITNATGQPAITVCAWMAKGWLDADFIIHAKADVLALAQALTAALVRPPDAIDAAVTAHLAPLAEDLTAFGHQLAKGVERVKCVRCDFRGPELRGDGRCPNCGALVVPVDESPAAGGA